MSGSTQGTATTARTAPRAGSAAAVETTTGTTTESRQCPTRPEGPQPLFQHLRLGKDLRPLRLFLGRVDRNVRLVRVIHEREHLGVKGI